MSPSEVTDCHWTIFADMVAALLGEGSMTYSGERTILDADSHVMELPGFLDDYIDDAHRDQLRRSGMDGFRRLIEEGSSRVQLRRDDPELAAGELMTAKGWFALGAFDPAERSRALDLLGFKAQLVFATFAGTLFDTKDPDMAYAGRAAQNKALNAFCSGDDRLLPVAFVPLSDTARAVALTEEAVGNGAAAVMVPSTPAGDRAPSHPDLDPFWDLLSRLNVPFVLHVGGGGRMLDPKFHNNAMPVTDHLGGGENIRSKDYLAIFHSPEVFLGTLVLDGVFDRFPKLRGGCIEQGAGWVVSWMRHLDQAHRAFRRTEEPLRRLRDRPSEYVRRHLKFTPFAGEPVGWMMDQAGPELFMFSSDYPHPEGGKDPLGKFEEAMEGTDEQDKRKFYETNMAEMLGGVPDAG